VQKLEDIDDPWQALAVTDSEVIPGIVDQTVLQWGLGQSVGDTLIYKNGAGRLFKIRIIAGLANSIFQGYVLISDSFLLKAFPSQAGFNVFLVDAAQANTTDVMNGLQERWQDQGAEIQPTTERMAMFNEITNTYLAMFLLLGGLALLIGSVGVGVVVTRNIHERRAELAVMAAIGFTLDEIRRTVQTEYRWLLLAGLCIGSVSATIAVLPAVWQQGMNAMVTLILLALIWGSGVYGIRRAVINHVGKEWLEVLRRDR
jgi:ABC-type antimicrobial peptide transport system permease subunit